MNKMKCSEYVQLLLFLLLHSTERFQNFIEFSLIADGRPQGRVKLVVAHQNGEDPLGL
jgi:hypothetical protein